MKGIILAGGNGSRLYPITAVSNKHLLPVFDKPMIYYPLSTLMLAGIQEILIISSSTDIHHFVKLLGDGHQWGVTLRYAIQATPRGLVDAFYIGKDFIGNDSVTLILGDNIFLSSYLDAEIFKIDETQMGATLFVTQVTNPEEYGVLEFSKNGEIVSLEEKPLFPKSNWIATGLYYYDNSVIEAAERVKPSHRNELEIMDLNSIYLNEKKLNIVKLQHIKWFDAGTPDSLLRASISVKNIQDEKQSKIGCPDEIALKLQYTKMKKSLVKQKHLALC